MANDIIDEMPDLEDLDPSSLVCSRCQVPAQFIEPDVSLETRQLLCSQCGRTDKFDVAVARAVEYVEQCITDKMQSNLQRAFAGSKAIDFIPDQPAPPPAFIFPLNMGE